jgi:hypothetical protein
VAKATQEQVHAALQFVDGRNQRLEAVVREAVNTGLADRLERWKAVTVEGLRELGADSAADKLRQISAPRYMSLGYGDSSEPNYDLEDAKLYQEFLIGLLQDLRQEPEAVLRRPQASAQASNVSVTREGVFVAGQQFDAFSLIARLLNAATATIEVVDNYLGDPLLQLLAAKTATVQVRILTGDVKPAVVALAGAFNKQHGGLSIRTTRAFHDRFLVIDAKDYYHFGASLKDLGNKGFMFSRIEERAVIKALRKQIDTEWSGATVVV